MSSNEENACDLAGELQILVVAQYFLDSFYKRAEMYMVKLPGL